MLGYEAGELHRPPLRRLLRRRRRRSRCEHFQRGIEGTESTPFFEVQVVRKDGALVDVEVRAGSLYRDGELIGRQGVARDISTLKQLQAEVADKSQRLTLLADQARIGDGPLPPDRRPHASRAGRPGGHESGPARRRGHARAREAQKLGLDAQDVAILELLGAGHSNREIGAQVHLSPNTVKDRVSKLMRILGRAQPRRGRRAGGAPRAHDRAAPGDDPRSGVTAARVGVVARGAW